MKFVNFIKSLLLFLLFLIFNYIIRTVGLDLLFACNHVVEFDLVDKLALYILLLFVTAVVYVIVFFLKSKVGNLSFCSIVETILNNKLKLFLWVTGLSISFFSGIILVLFPVLYYYIFKIFLKKYRFIGKYYLDFKTVKKYTFIFFIIEFPFILMTLCLFFDPKPDAGSGFAFWAYYMFGNFYFYLPFFILSWWDNRKLKMIEKICK